jgi:hypothetical protein
MLDAEPDRGVERMECEAVPPIKQKDRITGVQIRTATGRLEDLFAVDFYGEAVEKNASRVA